MVMMDEKGKRMARAEDHEYLNLILLQPPSSSSLRETYG